MPVAFYSLTTFPDWLFLACPLFLTFASFPDLTTTYPGAEESFSGSAVTFVSRQQPFFVLKMTFSGSSLTFMIRLRLSGFDGASFSGLAFTYIWHSPDLFWLKSDFLWFSGCLYCTASAFCFLFTLQQW